MSGNIEPLGTLGLDGHAYWYLTRATGLVAMILLSATVILGVVSAIGWTKERWPRVMSQTLHRNLSLYCLAVVALHIVTTVVDGYVSITAVDAFLPFASPYRPIWVGLGALAFDLLLAVALTSALRRRIGYSTWRGVHWLAYACWPIAVLHGLGTGSDSRQSLADLIYLVCIAAVGASVLWRLVAVPSPSAPVRVLAGVGTAGVVLATVVFAWLGPLQPGWSSHAGAAASVRPDVTAPVSLARPSAAKSSSGGTR